EMSGIIDKIFVYGTLQRGEERSCYMRGCRLSEILEVPGRLYDTGRGYPAAIFDDKSDSNVYGELYIMEEPSSRLEELDRVEGTETGLFIRSRIKYPHSEFYCYEAGPLLKETATGENRILSGSWRTYSSLAFTDPVDFALRFETHLKDSYKEHPGEDSDGIHYIRGHIPVLVTAPHATAHVRMGKLKRQEFYTGALAVLLHSVTGCHALYAGRLSSLDPNYTDESPFKAKLSEIAGRSGFEFLIDIHGTGSERPGDVFPGVGMNSEFLNGRPGSLGELGQAAQSNGISLGSVYVFPAARQKTVTRYSATRLGVPSMQLEINRNLRRPETAPSDFVKLVNFLKEFIGRLC
ncbi:MAG: gamma-glutamylcyclotransferase, partial [Candidatus Dadabacteria bacterium]|nr:gamma-glutamylcyclotransferase [Candidatus Dadabacteria bacterium]